jgi:hypothetical protein
MEDKHNLPAGWIMPRRVNDYAQAGVARAPGRRGPKEAPLQPLIFELLANNIQATQLTGKITYTKNIRRTLIAAFTKAGYKCRSGDHLIRKFRAAHPVRVADIALVIVVVVVSIVAGGGVCVVAAAAADHDDNDDAGEGDADDDDDVVAVFCCCGCFRGFCCCCCRRKLCASNGAT